MSSIFSCLVSVSTFDLASGIVTSLSGPGRNIKDSLGRDLKEPCRDDLPLRVVEVDGRILYADQVGFLIERIPDHVQPVGLRELLGLVPLVGRQPNRLAAHTALHLDTLDLNLSRDGVADPVGANIKANFLSANSLDVRAREPLGHKC